MPPLFTWHIFQIIIDCLSHLASACVLNQYSSHWLLFEALQPTFTMCLKWWEEVTNPPTQVNLIDNDFGICFELTLFATNIKKEVYGVMEHILFYFFNLKKTIS